MLHFLYKETSSGGGEVERKVTMLYQKVQLDLTAVSEVQGENQRRNSFPKCFHWSNNGYIKYINKLNNYLKSNAEMTGVLNIISLLNVYPPMACCCSWARNQIFGDYTVL